VHCEDAAAPGKTSFAIVRIAEPPAHIRRGWPVPMAPSLGQVVLHQKAMAARRDSPTVQNYTRRNRFDMASSMSGLLDGSSPASHGASGVDHGWAAQCGILTVIRRVRQPGDAVDERHPHIEILIPDAQATLHVTHEAADGRRRMAFVTGQQVCVIPADRLHAVHCQQPTAVVECALDAQYFAAAAAVATGEPACTPRGHFSIDDPFLTEIGRMLTATFTRARLPATHYLEALAGVLAMHLAIKYSQNKDTPSAHAGLPPHKLRRVEDHIRTRLAADVAVPELAALVDMSPFHFSRMFKRATGCSPRLYITLLRVARAKELLQHTALPLVAVAAKVGFATAGRFSEVFLKLTGTTPRAFRLQYADATLGPGTCSA
jgi:AraC family transcriptional regulator